MRNTGELTGLNTGELIGLNTRELTGLNTRELKGLTLILNVYNWDYRTHGIIKHQTGASLLGYCNHGDFGNLTITAIVVRLKRY